MIPALMGKISVLSAKFLLAELTLVGHVEMFAVSAFNVVLHCVGLHAKLPADQTNISRAGVVADKV